MLSFLCNPIRKSTTFFQSPNQGNWFIEGWTHRPIFIHHPRNRSLADGIEAWHFSTQQCSHQNPIVITGVCVCARATRACRSSLPEIREFRVARECHAALCRRLTLRGIFVACRRARKTNVSEMTRHLPGLGARSLLLLLVMTGSVNTGRDLRC